jgi:hypothetical protein
VRDAACRGDVAGRAGFCHDTLDIDVSTSVLGRGAGNKAIQDDDTGARGLWPFNSALPE